MSKPADPVLPILYRYRVANLGSDCDTTITVDSTGAVFSKTISWWNQPSTFEREIADYQQQAAQLYKDIEALRAIQRKVNERLGNNGR